MSCSAKSCVPKRSAAIFPERTSCSSTGTVVAAWDAADRAVQVFGGRGWSTLYRPGRHLTDVRVCRIYEGTDEILKLKIAANLLGKGFEAFK